MEVRIKYETTRSFKDKETKKHIKSENILDISLDRMKELNAKNAGRIIDVYVSTDENKKEAENVNLEENKNEESKGKNESTKLNYTEEQLNAMTVNELKELAEKNNIELKSAKKSDIVAELVK